MISVPVSLGARSYEVRIGEDLLATAGLAIPTVIGQKRLAVITDSNVARVHLEPLLRSLRFVGLDANEIVVPAGEPSKSLQTAEWVCEQMVAHRFDRSSAVIALGGGVIGDLAGFVAGIYFRGIPFVQIPTTVMAQVDSAVGGKTGVNTRNAKNLLGVFHQPSLVLADVSTLLTLPDRAFFEGFAEVIKHGIIRDRQLFEKLDAFRDQLPAIRTGEASLEPLASVIQGNVEIKAAIVAEDEQELHGLRALLNFGHTIGHAIEAVSGYGSLLHGEAISLGMVAAARLSAKRAGLPESECESIIDLLKRFELPTRLGARIDSKKVVDALLSDKKFEQGKIRFVLTSGIGDAFLSRDVTLPEIETEIAALAAE